MSRLISAAKSAYYIANIAGERIRPHDVQIIHELLPKPESRLPSCSSLQQLANTFSKFFHDEIRTIQEKWTSDQVPGYVPSTDVIVSTVETRLGVLPPASLEDIAQLVRMSPTKTCPLDPLLTWLLKDHIIKIMNLSLATRVVKRNGGFHCRLCHYANSFCQQHWSHVWHPPVYETGCSGCSDCRYYHLHRIHNNRDSLT